MPMNPQKKRGWEPELKQISIQNTIKTLQNSSLPVDNQTNQPTQQDKCSGDDDGNSIAQTLSDDFQNHTQHAKMTPLSNAGLSSLKHLAPGKCTLTIKSPVIDVSARLPVPERLLTVPDIAALLGVSRTTVYRMVEDRKISFVRVGSLVRFTKTNLEAFLQAGHINSIL